ncbi:hypothetical protein ACF061_00715 [Streptomyces sp. NPDC015220]|uniref:hypothetical protein n=1 Tax=Streptomyces sp. NPDC015220 TaxID=3364947 RepID=UPI0037031597
MRIQVTGEADPDAIDVTGGQPFKVIEVDTAISTGGGDVTSVNGQAGDVTLDAGSVGADPAGTATTAVNTHTAATDPHGDRAYADTNKLSKTANLSDLANPGTARSNLGLGGAALLNIGTSTGTVTAGDDSRLTGAMQKTANLSDLSSASTARTNLGLGGAATLAVGTAAGTVAAGNDSRLTGAAQKASNLSDLASAATARTNLGLGGAATLNVGTTTGTVAAGDDTRLTNARTPTAHASTHASGGSDPVSPASIGALTQTTADGLYAGLATFGNVWTPSDHGLIAWSLDPAACTTTGTTLSAGFIYLLGVVLRQATTISKVNAVIGTAGATLTAGQCLAGLYDSAGTRRGITADMSTTWNSVGNKAMSLTGSYSAPAGRYYIAMLFNGTTSPTFAAGSTFGSTFTPGNANLAAGSYRFCRSASGQTSLPASITLSGYTPDANNVWAAVS